MRPTGTASSAVPLRILLSCDECLLFCWVLLLAESERGKQSEGQPQQYTRNFFSWMRPDLVLRPNVAGRGLRRTGVPFGRPLLYHAHVLTRWCLEHVHCICICTDLLDLSCCDAAQDNRQQIGLVGAKAMMTDFCNSSTALDGQMFF